MFGFDDPFSSESNNNGRDKRRAFTQTQKNNIRYQQGEKCAICKKPLDARTTQYDHKKPWADKGRTVSENGRALHAECHAIKTHEERLTKIEGKKPAKRTPAKKVTVKNVAVTKKKSSVKRKKSSSSLFDISPLDYKMPDIKMPKGPKGGFGLF